MARSHRLPDPLPVRPVTGPIRGRVSLPGSKSLTNRAILIASLANGCSILRNVSPSDDSQVMVKAVSRLGAGVKELRGDGSVLAVEGTAGQIRPARRAIHTGEAGTVLRFLLPVLSLGSGTYRIEGGDRLKTRPLSELTAALEQLGISIEPQQGRQSLPLRLRAPGGITGGALTLDARRSSQFASALFMAAPYFEKGLLLTLKHGALASRPYLEMTRRLMAFFGVDVSDEGNCRFRIPGGRRYGARDTFIEGDASGSSYFFGAAAICGGGVRCINLDGVGSIQGDVKFLRVLEQMGCRPERGPGWIGLTSVGPPLDPIDVDMNDMPDMVQTLAVVSLFARGRTTIRNVAHLRWKESDRLGKLCRELERVGGRVMETDDGLIVEGDGGRRLQGACVETHRDHRMAMSLSLVGLRIPGVSVRDPGCVDKSFPDFFRYLDRLRRSRIIENRAGTEQNTGT